MSFGVRCDFWIRSFEDCEDRYAKTKPIRGKGIVPIESRRKQHMQIIKYEGSYALKLYDTEVVTYHRDGRIVINTKGWSTQSTCAFIAASLPSSWSCHKNRRTMYVVDRASNYAAYIVGDKPLTLHPNGLVDGAMTPYKKIVDREVSKKLRAPFKDFIKWTKAYLTVLNFEVPPMDEVFSNTWARPERINTILKYPNLFTEDMYIELLALIHSVTCRPRYVWQTGSYGDVPNDQAYKKIAEYVRNQLTQHTRVPLPIGQYDQSY